MKAMVTLTRNDVIYLVALTLAAIILWPVKEYFLGETTPGYLLATVPAAYMLGSLIAFISLWVLRQGLKNHSAASE